MTTLEHVVLNEHPHRVVLGALPEVVELVHHELKPNSGQSIKDFQIRTDMRFRAIETKLGIDPDREDLEQTR